MRGKEGEEWTDRQRVLDKIWKGRLEGAQGSGELEDGREEMGWGNWRGKVVGWKGENCS